MDTTVKIKDIEDCQGDFGVFDDLLGFNQEILIRFLQENVVKTQKNIKYSNSNMFKRKDQLNILAK